MITWEASDLAAYLDAECTVAPPSLEGMLNWAESRGVLPVLNPPRYTFISHMHDNTAANKLGPQLDAIKALTGLLWLDLTSMYQGHWAKEYSCAFCFCPAS